MKDSILRKQKEYLAGMLNGKTLMISGGTGLIGSGIVRFLMDLNDHFHANVRMIVLYRNEEKKERIYSIPRQDLSFLIYDEKRGVCGDVPVDYIIHAAGISGGSKMHLKDPVRIFTVGILGTKALLDYGVTHGCEKFCYVSTYEVYGAINSEDLIRENHPCVLDPMLLRNCYAEVKRTCESMLTAYAAAYSIKVYSGRLSSAFGAGVAYHDPRFFAEFSRCVLENKDIVLKTLGKTIRSYLDVDDAASAFLYILVNGENNNAYNLTNMSNTISIRDMAYKIIQISKSNVQLKFDISDDRLSLGFRSEGCTLVDAGKLEALGWKPVYTIDETIEKMLISMEKDRKANLNSL